jgi:hypothetical protein
LTLGRHFLSKLFSALTSSGTAIKLLSAGSKFAMFSLGLRRSSNLEKAFAYTVPAGGLLFLLNSLDLQLKPRSKALTPQTMVKVDSSVFTSQLQLRCLVFADFEIKSNVIGFKTAFAYDFQAVITQFLDDEVAASAGNSLASTMTMERCRGSSGPFDVSFFFKYHLNPV